MLGLERPWIHRGMLAAAGLVLSTAAHAQGVSSALLFDGIDDYAIAASNADFNLQQGFTLEAWMRPTTLGANENLITRQTVAGQFAPWSFTVQSNMLRLWIQSSDVLSVPGLIAGQLQHVAVTWTAGTGAVVFYLDGTQFSTATAQTSLPALPYNVVVGGLNGAPAWTLNGSLDEVRVWNRVRTPSEILATCGRRLTVPEAADPTLVAYWPMDAGSGQFETDQSIYTHDLQLGATPVVDSFDPTWIGGAALDPMLLCVPGLAGVAACPCTNPPQGAGRGCNNSSATGGALLLSSGSASLANDSLVVSTSGEKPTALSIVLQGDAVVASGAVFGQGIRCVAGSLKRLYIKSASSGSITAPGLGDPTVSARSAALGDSIAPGGVRWYGVYYRDPIVLGACPASSTFNITPTLAVFWAQ